MINDLVRRFTQPGKKHVVAPSGQLQIPHHLRNASALRRNPTSLHDYQQMPKRGMWVVYMGRVGVLTDLRPGDIAVIALADATGANATQLIPQPDGSTKIENITAYAPAADCRQATFDEIPKPRRPDVESARRLGYLS